MNIFIWITSLLLTSFYSLKFECTNGTQVDCKTFEGKKVLIVNVASNSKYFDQVSDLKSLYDTHSDSLVIILCPSNSFYNEPLKNDELTSVFNNDGRANFYILKKGSVKGNNLLPIYDWIGSIEKNEMMTGTVVEDYQKFLINESGKLVGSFNAGISPKDSVLITAINNNYSN